MSADLLSIGYFLLLGSLILTGGRTINTCFLHDHYKRRRRNRRDMDSNTQLFELDEPPVGSRNRD